MVPCLYQFSNFLQPLKVLLTSLLLGEQEIFMMQLNDPSPYTSPQFYLYKAETTVSLLGCLLDFITVRGIKFSRRTMHSYKTFHTTSICKLRYSRSGNTRVIQLQNRAERSGNLRVKTKVESCKGRLEESNISLQYLMKCSWRTEMVLCYVPQSFQPDLRKVHAYG